MNLYRFSPILDEVALAEAIRYLHITCHELCKQALGHYLPVSGSVGIFCHDYEEFATLTAIRQQLCDESVNYNHKYFRLLEPIVIAESDGVPGATYEFLYVRKADPYRSQVGDIDFVLPAADHAALKANLQTDEFSHYARNFERPEENMIELWDPHKDVLSYLVTQKMRDLVPR